jgi:hypothetical protein
MILFRGTLLASSSASQCTETLDALHLLRYGTLGVLKLYTLAHRALYLQHPRASVVLCG